MGFVFSERAYLKVLLHVHKHAESDVNGVLLARASAGGKSSAAAVEVVDAVPLFHDIMLAPMFETAMLQIDVYCRTK
jgi:hypothetical protein